MNPHRIRGRVEVVCASPSKIDFTRKISNSGLDTGSYVMLGLRYAEGRPLTNLKPGQPIIVIALLLSLRCFDNQTFVECDAYRCRAVLLKYLQTTREEIGVLFQDGIRGR